jgi:deazaflavin-dependent oxidoreductase (nitroreductase family)
MTDWNAKIIEEFRANGGAVTGAFEGKPLLLLHHVGAKSGTERVTPMMYQEIDGGYAVFASNAGKDNNPAWFHNLMANPKTSAEIGSATLAVTAVETANSEREAIWERQKAAEPGFADYEQSTARTIPVVKLTPA